MKHTHLLAVEESFAYSVGIFQEMKSSLAVRHEVTLVDISPLPATA
jgi:hypothetical protein